MTRIVIVIVLPWFLALAFASHRLIAQRIVWTTVADVLFIEFILVLLWIRFF